MNSIWKELNYTSTFFHIFNIIPLKPTPSISVVSLHFSPGMSSGFERKNYLEGTDAKKKKKKLIF